MLGSGQLEYSSGVSNPEMQAAINNSIAGTCFRFLEEMGFFSITIHGLGKRRYNRHMGLETKLSSKARDLIENDTRIRVSTGLNLDKIEAEIRFKRLLPVIKQSFELWLRSLGELFSLYSVHVGILENLKNVWCPKACIVLVGHRQRLISTKKAAVFLGYDTETKSIPSYRKALCRIYNGRLDFIDKDDFEKQTVDRIIQRCVLGIYNN